MAASLKPLRDKVVVERSEAEEKTSGGIVLPDEGHCDQHDQHQGSGDQRREAQLAVQVHAPCQ